MVGEICQQTRRVEKDPDKGHCPEQNIKGLVEVVQWKGQNVYAQEMTGKGDNSGCHDKGKIGREQVTDPVLNHAGTFL